VPNIQWRTPDDGERNCQKYVDFLGKNKFGKIGASVGFIKNKIIYSTCKRHDGIKQGDKDDEHSQT
jgi:hypothetical protein